MSGRLFQSLLSRETMMIASIYGALEKIGFDHPLHPIIVHLPMGMIIGMFLFSLLGLKWKDSHFPRTAYHCSVLALVSIPFVILAGIMDWQYRLNGDWAPQIKIKMVLASILTVLLIYAVIARGRGASPKHLFVVYTLCLLCAGGLGYEGGQLVYG
jgi:uncharacterized membrane protein